MEILNSTLKKSDFKSDPKLMLKKSSVNVTACPISCFKQAAFSIHSLFATFHPQGNV